MQSSQLFDSKDANKIIKTTIQWILINIQELLLHYMHAQ